MTTFGGRVRVLERETRRMLGCQTCRRRDVVNLADEEPWPAWMDERGNCRDCGRPVKVYAGIDLAAI